MKSLHSSQERNGHDIACRHSSNDNASREQHRQTTVRNATERPALKVLLLAYNGPVPIIVESATCSTEAADVPILVQDYGARNSHAEVAVVVFDIACCEAFVVIFVAVDSPSASLGRVSVFVYDGLHILQVRQWCSALRETLADLDVTRSHMPTRRDMILI